MTAIVTLRAAVPMIYPHVQRIYLHIHRNQARPEKAL